MDDNFNGNNMANSTAFLTGRIKWMNKSKRICYNPIVPLRGTTSSLNAHKTCYRKTLAKVKVGVINTSTVAP